MLYFINQTHYVEAAATDANGDFASGLTITYEVRKSSDNTLISSGTMSEIGTTGVYKASVTFTAIGQYHVLYTFPIGYRNQVETINVIDPIAKQSDLETIKQIETGRWKMVGNQMIFYEDDNVTEICRFNLFDAAGNGSMFNVTERKRV